MGGAPQNDDLNSRVHRKELLFFWITLEDFSVADAKLARIDEGSVIDAIEREIEASTQLGDSIYDTMRGR